MMIDKQAVLKRVAGKASLLRKIIAQFLARCPEYLEGLQAAIAAGDPGEVGVYAHRIKGTAANFEAHEVVAVADRLEHLGRSGELAGADEQSRQLAAALEALKACLLEWDQSLQAE